ncbi:MAG TPA: PhzF family phenazine biosynthesis protein [Gaiella sp.]|nr:PhzF family phenazine biosynthesis protein [Gaiella sp.]
MATAYRYVVADVFTDRPLTGNPLAVFTDGRGLDDETMQRVARELNLSETVFVFPAEQGGTARIRIFTPLQELPFAGHPTLGTAFVLGLPLQRGVIELETGVGTVPVVLERDSQGGIAFGRMTQPVPRVEEVDPAPYLAALRVEEQPVLPVERYDNGTQHTLVGLASLDAVAAVVPDHAALVELGGTGVTVFAGEGTRWTARMFAPAHGVPEDPATGSMAGPLACHLCRHGLVPWGEEVVVSQGGAIGRPSTLHARAEGGDGLIDAVEVGGAAVIVARGEFRF